jgi:ABC-type multidrug transport system permease subunit
MQVLGSLLVPISYTLVVFLGASATSAEPVAVVNLDHGPIAAQLVKAIVADGVFRVTVTSPAQARRLYEGLRVAAVITIPAGLSQRAAAHQPAPVGVRLDNLNLDVAGDIRNALPDAITSYYAGLGRASPLRVSIAEHSLRRHTVQLYQYSVLPVIILIVTVNGIIVSGMAAAGEWETRTVKELLLAPVSRVAVVTGKMLAGFLSTSVLATTMLVLGAAIGWIPLYGWSWVAPIGAIALAAAFAAGVGIAIGTWCQRRQPVTVVATIAAVEFFALSGGLGVIWFEPVWLQRVAIWDPLTYAVHSLQQAAFYHSFNGVLLDTAVLIVAAGAAAAAGSLAMRRELAVS